MGLGVQHLGEAAPLDLLATESGRLAFEFGAAVVVGALGPYVAPLRDPSIADAGRSLRFSGLEPLEAWAVFRIDEQDGFHERGRT